MQFSANSTYFLGCPLHLFCKKFPVHRAQKLKLKIAHTPFCLALYKISIRDRLLEKETASAKKTHSSI